MKTNKYSSRKKKTTWILLAAAVILLSFSALQGARAALTYVSDNYTAQLSVSQIGVSLLENGSKVSYRDYTGSGDTWSEGSSDLLTKMIPAGDKLELGKKYQEELNVQNSGKIDEYVRVTITKSWTDADGNKVTSLSPTLINLNLTGNGWVKDDNASTDERTVLYYTGVVASGASTPNFSDTINIDNAVASKYTESSTTDANGYTTITTTYQYDGVKFNLEATVDAVQTHNAKDAIKSAWGVDMNVASDGTLSLQ